MRAPIESLKKVFAAVVYTGTQHGGSAPSPIRVTHATPLMITLDSASARDY